MNSKTPTSNDTVPGQPCKVCGKPTTGFHPGSNVYHRECLMTVTKPMLDRLKKFNESQK